MKKTAADKTILRLYKERDDLWTQKKNLGWEELNPPIRDGYVKYLVLREDIARSSNARFYQNILDKIQHKHYRPTKDFTRKRKGAKHKKRYPVMCVPRALQPHEYQKLSNTERTYFDRRERIRKVTKTLSYLQIDYVFRYPWMFVEKISPHYLTKIKKEDLELDIALERIWQKISNEKIRHRYGWLKGYANNADYCYDLRWKYIQKVQRQEIFLYVREGKEL